MFDNILEYSSFIFIIFLNDVIRFMVAQITIKIYYYPAQHNHFHCVMILFRGLYYVFIFLNVYACNQLKYLPTFLLKQYLFKFYASRI